MENITARIKKLIKDTYKQAVNDDWDLERNQREKAIDFTVTLHQSANRRAEIENGLQAQKNGVRPLSEKAEICGKQRDQTEGRGDAKQLVAKQLETQSRTEGVEQQSTEQPQMLAIACHDADAPAELDLGIVRFVFHRPRPRFE